MSERHEEFGRVLKKLRKEASLTQAELLEKLGEKTDLYGDSTISKWEKGRQLPRKAHIEALAEILHVPKEVLFKATGKIESIVIKTQQEHLEEIHSLIEQWKRDLKRATSPKHRPTFGEYEAEEDKLFRYLLQHCPSLSEKYQAVKDMRDDYGYVENCFALGRDVFTVASKWIADITGCIAWPGGMDEAMDFGYSPFVSEFVDSAEYWLLGQYAKQSQQTMDESFNQCARRYSYLDDETISEIRVRWQKAEAELLNKYATRDNLKEKILRHLRRYYEAEDALEDAVDTSLKSNEWLRHKCDWCP